MPIHDGHRQRLRKRFLASPSSFEDHELLELLLFYIYPRVNTNEIAHNLLNRFGSLKGVLDAGIPALTQVQQIGDNAALFFRVVSETLSRYKLEYPKSINAIDSHETLARYLCSLFAGTDNEVTYLLLFDSKNKLISCTNIGEGYSCGNVLSMRTITTLTMNSNAASAIVVHNHPNGKAIPSGEDLAATNNINTVMSLNGVKLIDHFIIAGNECTPILNPSKAPLYNQHTTEKGE